MIPLPPAGWVCRTLHCPWRQAALAEARRRLGDVPPWAGDPGRVVLHLDADGTITVDGGGLRADLVLQALERAQHAVRWVVEFTAIEALHRRRAAVLN